MRIFIHHALQGSLCVLFIFVSVRDAYLRLELRVSVFEER